MHQRKYFTMNFFINEIFSVEKFPNYGICCKFTIVSNIYTCQLQMLQNNICCRLASYNQYSCQLASYNTRIIIVFIFISYIIQLQLHTYRHISTIPTTPGSLLLSEPSLPPPPPPPPPPPHLPLGEGQAQGDVNVNSCVIAISVCIVVNYI